MAKRADPILLTSGASYNEENNFTTLFFNSSNCCSG